MNEELVDNCGLTKHRPWTLALKMTAIYGETTDVMRNR